MARIMSGILVFLLLSAIGCSNDFPAERDIVLEVAASMDDLIDTPSTRGKELYSRYCSVCHGTTGRGDGFNAFNLNPKPRNFTDSAFVTRLDTSLIRETISRGGTAVGLSGLMPQWGKTLTKRDIDDLTSHVIALNRE